MRVHSVIVEHFQLDYKPQCGMVSVPFETTEEYGIEALFCDRSVTFARLLTNLEHFSVNERMFFS